MHNSAIHLDRVIARRQGPDEGGNDDSSICYDTPFSQPAPILGESRVGGQKSSAAKLLLAALTCVFVVAAVLLSRHEQRVRSASEEAHQILDQIIAAGETLTDAQVHERLQRDPVASYRPGRNKYVEEYHWAGNFDTYKVYVYYTSAATKLLTAVSINQEHPDWKQSENKQ